MLGSFFANMWLVLARAFYTIVIAFPIVVLDLPNWIEYAIIALSMIFPSVFGIVGLPLWVWGLAEMIMGPQDVFAIIYYVLFVVIALPVLLRIAINLFTGNIGR